jgi:hypothetical protein
VLLRVLPFTVHWLLFTVIDMSEDKEKFLSRWSRVKRETREQPPAKTAAAAGPPPELPPLDALDFNSNLKDFFHPEVDEKLRRAALKKLLSDPRFNVMDGLDVYIDDYGKADPIPPEMLQQLVQAQNIFASLKKDAPEQDKPQPAQVDGTAANAALAEPTHTDTTTQVLAPAVNSGRPEPEAKS